MADISGRELALAGMPVGLERTAREERRWIRLGLVVLAATIGVAVVWSSTAPLASAVVAPGAIKVDSSRKKVQHAEGGVVKEILVREGARVRSGDVLVRLDETKAGAAHGLVRGGQDIAQATVARLLAERDDLASVRFPAELLARRGDAQVAEILRSQDQQFQVRRSARLGEIGILDQQIRALRSEIDGLASQQRSKEEQIASLRSDLASLVDLDSQGMVEKTRLRSVERDVAKLVGERDEIVSKIATSRTAISEKELRKFQVRKSFQEEVAAELRKLQTEQMELNERIGATRRALELTELRAPVDGTVTDLRVHTPGGVAGPGEVLMELVPEADRLVVEARVPPTDIDRVHLGLPAGIKLHAFNARTTPELDATVSYVSADAVVDPRTEISYFVVKLDVPAEQVARLGGLKLQPGMQSDVFIRTGERTFFGYLLQPLADSFRKAWLER